MELIIIGVVIALLVAIYFFGVEKRMRSNPIFLVISVVVTIGFGGYILGSMGTPTIPNIFLVLLFFGGGIWRLLQLIKLKTVY